MTARRTSGFTFIELLVTLTVLGALSAIAVPRYRDYTRRARVAALQGDLGNLRVAQEEHWADYQRYATDTSSLGLRTTTDVSIRLSSEDVAGGYTAVATHRLVPGQQCSTAMGREAAPREPGAIYCGPAGSGAGTLLP